MAIGAWTVDHRRLRERTDAGNSTLEPRTQVKDFSTRMANKSWAYDDSQDLCCFQDSSGSSQPRWAVDPSAQLLPTSTDADEIWRTYDATSSVCVDFWVPIVSGTRATLPRLLQYWGGCTDPSAAHPDTETLAQTNEYPPDAWSLDTPAPELFAAPSGCEVCAATAPLRDDAADATRLRRLRLRGGSA